MTFTENEITHLNLIQSVISRMANNSFLLKGWCITLIAALIALGIGKDIQMWIVCLLPLFGFWYLDAFFLKTERAYRSLYEKVILKDGSVPLFSLNPALSGVNHSIWQAFCSQTLLFFYGPLGLIMVIVYLLAE